MRAAFMPGPGRIEVAEFPDPPAPGDGELLVRTEFSSICGSDLHIVHQGFQDAASMGEPGYPGHEGVGVVVASGSAEFGAGSRVLTLPPGPVARCFAEYQLLPASQCIPVPEALAPEHALMAQQYGTTRYAMRLFWPPEGRETGTCAIIGAGSAGLYFVQLALRAGFRQVIVSDLDLGRLRVATELGATRVVHAPQESIVDAVLEATGGEGADLVIESAGYDACRSDAVAAVRRLGIVGLFGFPEVLGDAPFPQNAAFRKVARIQWAGATQAEPGLRSFREALDEISENKIIINHCLGERFPLERIAEAIDTAQHPGRGGVKLLVDLR